MVKHVENSRVLCMYITSIPIKTHTYYSFRRYNCTHHTVELIAMLKKKSSLFIVLILDELFIKKKYIKHLDVTAKAFNF